VVGGKHDEGLRKAHLLVDKGEQFRQGLVEAQQIALAFICSYFSIQAPPSVVKTARQTPSAAGAPNDPMMDWNRKNRGQFGLSAETAHCQPSPGTLGRTP
jgi:hypothetical protein